MNGGVCFGCPREKTGPLSDFREFCVFFVNLETSGVDPSANFHASVDENVFYNPSAKLYYYSLGGKRVYYSGAAKF